MSADSRGKAGAEGKAGRLTPGAHLRAEIERLDLDQVAVGKATGVSRQSVNNIINGRQAISRAMAGKLGRLTGRSSDYWLSEWFSKERGTDRTAGVTARVVGVLVDHQIERAVKNGIIGIAPFAAHNLQAASIGLTLNDTLATVSGKLVTISRRKGFVLEPGSTVSASTLERIELPLDYLGRIGAVNRLASLGIVASHPFQIEPGFKGRLHFCLFNAGTSPLQLRPLDPVIGLEIIRLSASAAGPATT